MTWILIPKSRESTDEDDDDDDLKTRKMGLEYYFRLVCNASTFSQSRLFVYSAMMALTICTSAIVFHVSHFVQSNVNPILNQVCRGASSTLRFDFLSRSTTVWLCLCVWCDIWYYCRQNQPSPVVHLFRHLSMLHIDLLCNECHPRHSRVGRTRANLSQRRWNSYYSVSFGTS